jgi:hypothetical protein
MAERASYSLRRDRGNWAERRGWNDLPERLRATVRDAEVLLGSPRQLDLVPAFP